MSTVKHFQIFCWPRTWDRFFAKDIERYLKCKQYFVECLDKCHFPSLAGAPDNSLKALDDSHSIAVLERGSQRFFLISHVDSARIDPMLVPLICDKKCIGLLKCQYSSNATDSAIRRKVAPFTYNVRDAWTFNRLLEIMPTVKASEPVLYFKGNPKYGRRKVLERLTSILNPDFSSRDGQGDSLERYMMSLRSARFALSLPGRGNFCHRELEAFALGVPVLQPVLINQYYFPLIAGTHYVGVPATECPEALAKSLISVFYEYCDRSFELQEVAANAKKWYAENVEFPGNMQLMEQILKNEFDYAP